jgi:phosphotransferase system enzyme I (PtsI)
VPAVVGLHDASRRVPPGASLIVDGESGTLTIEPSAAELEEAGRRSIRVGGSAPGPWVDQGPLTTADGVRVTLHANIERAGDVAAALGAGAEGIGLYRSEFLLAGGAPDLAAEDEQYGVYRQVVERMAPRPVTIRTFDVDERQLARPLVDTALDTRWFPDHERIGHAGLRGVRFGLAHPEIFKTQLRALLRAAAHGPLRIMFPFVSSLQDVREARALLAEAREELAARGIATAEVPIGVMIEVPSAAFTASLLAREVDFFTIGTNDLIQYTLAVDRTDDRVSDRYEPLHPAILRLLRHVRRAGVRAGIPVAVCGEMASDPLLLKLLIGCGLTEFSMTPGALPMARRVVQDTRACDLQRVAAKVLSLGTPAEIERCLAEELSAGATADVGSGTDH